MRRFFSRVALAGSMLVLATGMPALAQSSSDESARSTSDQSDEQTTSDESTAKTSDDNESSATTSENATGHGQESAYDRTGSQDQNDSRYNQEDRERSSQAARQGSQRDEQQRRRLFGNRGSNREPAIGVTVVERGGMGVRVTRVNSQSPAAQAGIRPGDTIIEVDGRRVSSPRELVSAIQNSEVGETADFAVLRDGREQSLQVRLSSRQEALGRDQQGGMVQRFSELGRQYGQRDQAWPQGQSQWDPQRQQYGQPGQYSQQDNQGQYRQGQSERGQYGQTQYGQQTPYGQQPRGWDENRQAGGYNQGMRDQYAGSARQAYYDDDQRQPQNQRRWSDDGIQDRDLADRLSERLDRLENRFEQITQLLQRLEQNQDRQQQEASRQAYRSTDEGRQ